MNNNREEKSIEIEIIIEMKCLEIVLHDDRNLLCEYK